VTGRSGGNFEKLGSLEGPKIKDKRKMIIMRNQSVATLAIRRVSRQQVLIPGLCAGTLAFTAVHGPKWLKCRQMIDFKYIIARSMGCVRSLPSLSLFFSSLLSRPSQINPINVRFATHKFVVKRACLTTSAALET